MSDLLIKAANYLEAISLTTTLGGVFVASVIGSLHCVGMCGGLAMAFAPTRGSLALWQFFRLLGYLIVGGLAGLIGRSAFRIFEDWAWLSGLFLALSLILVGLSLLGWKPLFAGERASGVAVLIFRKLLPRGSEAGSGVRNETLRRHLFASVGGLLTALLPCGWLYSFVLAAASTGNVIHGATLLLVFWAGTVPALAVGPVIVRKLPKPAVRLFGILFLFLGLTALGIRGYQAWRMSTMPIDESCPFHETSSPDAT